MARETQLFEDSYPAAADLSAKQYTGVALTTDNPCKVNLPGSDGLDIIGVVQNKPTSGQTAAVRIYGITKVLVDSGGGVTAGDKLKVIAATGGVATATSGTFVVGLALETAAASTYVSMLLRPGGKI